MVYSKEFFDLSDKLEDYTKREINIDYLKYLELEDKFFLEVSKTWPTDKSVWKANMFAHFSMFLVPEFVQSARPERYEDEIILRNISLPYHNLNLAIHDRPGILMSLIKQHSPDKVTFPYLPMAYFFYEFIRASDFDINRELLQ